MRLTLHPALSKSSLQFCYSYCCYNLLLGFPPWLYIHPLKALSTAQDSASQTGMHAQIPEDLVKVQIPIQSVWNGA